MKPNALFSCLCGLFVLAGCGKEAEQARQRAEKELETVRTELEEVKTERGNLQNETARLRKDNEDLLRLRNEVRQLRDAQKQLTQQAQSAQTEIQRAQAQTQAAQAQAQAAHAQAQAAQAQAQALGSNAAPALTLQQQQEFVKRYGLDPAAVTRDGATPLTGAQALANACINNLRQIDSAKQQWALENRKTAEAIPTAQDIAPYLKDGVPRCPAGGTYTLNAVGAHPACSTPGHAPSP